MQRKALYTGDAEIKTQKLRTCFQAPQQSKARIANNQHAQHLHRVSKKLYKIVFVTSSSNVYQIWQFLAHIFHLTSAINTVGRLRELGEVETSANHINLSFLLSVCQQLWKSVEIWQRYGKNNIAQFFWETVYKAEVDGNRSTTVDREAGVGFDGYTSRRSDRRHRINARRRCK